MGAETTIKVKVLRLTEDVVEVSAVTLSDAMNEAIRLPGVARVLSAWYPDEEPNP